MAVRRHAGILAVRVFVDDDDAQTEYNVLYIIWCEYALMQ